MEGISIPFLGEDMGWKRWKDLLRVTQSRCELRGRIAWW